MVDDRDGEGGGGCRVAAAPGCAWRWEEEAKKKAEERKKGGGEKRRGRVEEEYAAARKSRPIFQRGTIATERPGDHLKYLVAGRKLSGTGSR